MGKKVSEVRSFITGVARYGDLFYILSKEKSFLEDDVAHTCVNSIDRKQWMNVKNVNWNSTAAAIARVPSEKLVVIGEYGDVFTYVSGNITEEKITPKPTLIRSANTIDDQVYVCGMKRECFKRTGEDRWINISAPKPRQGETAGFEAVDGFSADELYAVGWEGEIWWFDGNKWSPIQDITNLILTSVHCAGDGMVYAVGQKGTLLRGRKNDWEALEIADDFNEDLWGLCWFNDKLYVSSMLGLYTFEDEYFTDVDLGKYADATTYHLSTSENVLWSVGGEDVLSFDGKKWAHFN